MWGVDEFLELLKLVVNKGASDLHLMVPGPPILRIDGAIVPQQGFPPLHPKDMEKIFEHITTPEQRKDFLKEQGLDFAYSVSGVARFRASVLKQRGTLSLVFRLVPFKVFSIDALGLPQICKKLILKPRGLILITGPAASGKSTTMAAMIDHLNKTDARSVVTIEDPIEYLHRNNKCVIAQQDLGEDTRSFANALKYALRHDPDVIAIGEMRDLDTISTAIRAAETGHLVLGTLHTNDATQTVDRIIEIFPPDQHQQIRIQLSQVIEAILSQTLLPRIGGGRTAAFEILIATPAVRNLIRTGQSFELPNVMRLCSKEGMQTLEQALTYLVGDGLVSQEDALMKSNDPDRLKKSIKLQPVGSRPVTISNEAEQVAAAAGQKRPR